METITNETPSITTTVIEMAWRDLRVIASVGVAAGRDNARPILTAIHLTAGGGEIQAVATDSYRLATATTEHDGPEIDALIPAKWLLTAVKSTKPLKRNETTAKVTLSITGDTVTVSNYETTFTTQMVSGQFPKVAQLIPTSDNYKSELGSFNPTFLAGMHDITSICDPGNTTASWKCLSMSEVSPSLWATTCHAERSWDMQYQLMPVRA